MRKHISLLLVLIILISFCSCSKAEDELPAYYTSSDNLVNIDVGEYILGKTSPFLTEKKLCYITEDQLSTDDNLKCQAAILINATENELIFGQDIFNKVYPASITKLLTALVILKNGNMDDVVTIPEDNCGIVEEGAQLMGFKKGDQVSIRDLLYCLLIYSGNDSASALALYYSGSEDAFCEDMNKEAKKLGCSGTHFTNPHGLHDNEHYTTAYDEYIIMQECLKYDLFKNICQTSEYECQVLESSGSYRTLSFGTTNKFKKGVYEMPGDLSIVGAKTGNTYAAGNCLMMAVDDKDGNEYIVGMFGAESSDVLYTQMQYLMEQIVKSDDISNEVSDE